MSHCYTELLDHYCKPMSLESANVNYKPCLPSALLGLRRYWPFIRIRTVFPHKFYSQVARSEWNLIQSYLSIPRVSLLLWELLLLHCNVTKEVLFDFFKVCQLKIGSKHSQLREYPCCTTCKQQCHLQKLLSVLSPAMANLPCHFLLQQRSPKCPWIIQSPSKGLSGVMSRLSFFSRRVLLSNKTLEWT